jgi:hypothetical protein
MVGLPVYPARPKTFRSTVMSTSSKMAVGSLGRMIWLVTRFSADTRLAALSSSVSTLFAALSTLREPNRGPRHPATPARVHTLRHTEFSLRRGVGRRGHIDREAQVDAGCARRSATPEYALELREPFELSSTEGSWLPTTTARPGMTVGLLKPGVRVLKLVKLTRRGTGRRAENIARLAPVTSGQQGKDRLQIFLVQLFWQTIWSVDQYYSYVATSYEHFLWVKLWVNLPICHAIV